MKIKEKSISLSLINLWLKKMKVTPSLVPEIMTKDFNDNRMATEHEIELLNYEIINKLKL